MSSTRFGALYSKPGGIDVARSLIGRHTLSIFSCSEQDDAPTVWADFSPSPALPRVASYYMGDKSPLYEPLYPRRGKAVVRIQIQVRYPSTPPDARFRPFVFCPSRTDPTTLLPPMTCGQASL
jgi:hypothetical protein